MSLPSPNNIDLTQERISLSVMGIWLWLFIIHFLEYSLQVYISITNIQRQSCSTKAPQWKVHLKMWRRSYFCQPLSAELLLIQFNVHNISIVAFSNRKKIFWNFWDLIHRPLNKSQQSCRQGQIGIQSYFPLVVFNVRQGKSIIARQALIKSCNHHNLLFIICNIQHLF